MNFAYRCSTNKDRLDQILKHDEHVVSPYLFPLDFIPPDLIKIGKIVSLANKVRPIKCSSLSLLHYIDY